MPVRIIAELGINHNNRLDMAELMIRCAKEAGADFVKLQASTVAEEVSASAAPAHMADLARWVPSFDFIRDCAIMAREIGIGFLCTPAGEESLDFVVSLGVPAIKVASDNLTNVPFLQAVARKNLPVILSTGMARIEDIQFADQIVASRQHRLTILHCVTAYPCPTDQANLSALRTLAKVFSGAAIGFSDHTQSKEVPAIAVGMGAQVIEKHITFDRYAEGPDHAASLDINDFANMVDLVRMAESAMGTGSKTLQPIEVDNQRNYGKSIVAKTAIRMGEILHADKITVKRPGTGIPARRWNSIIGLTAGRDYAPDELIEQ